MGGLGSLGPVRTWVIFLRRGDPAYANIGMDQRRKKLTWLADSRSNVKSFPAAVQDEFGYAL